MSSMTEGAARIIVGAVEPERVASTAGEDRLATDAERPRADNQEPDRCGKPPEADRAAWRLDGTHASFSMTKHARRVRSSANADAGRAGASGRP